VVQVAVSEGRGDIDRAAVNKQVVLLVASLS
jgi:hypothetical protein